MHKFLQLFSIIRTSQKCTIHYIYFRSNQFSQHSNNTGEEISGEENNDHHFLYRKEINSLNSLPQGQSFTQDYFISEIVPVFTKEKLRFRRHHPGVTFSVHIDNSRCHNGRMATAEFDRRRLARAEHLPSSPDLSPCDFWFLEFLKKKLKDRYLRGVQSRRQAITNLWDELTFEDVQAVFLEWMNRLSCVIENKGEYFIK
jgi:hypothetical protein